MAASRREHLVDTALELFMRDGFHATGIDGILDTTDDVLVSRYLKYRPTCLFCQEGA